MRDVWEREAMKKQKPTCSFCGTPDFLIRSHVADGLPGEPIIKIYSCARCDDVRRNGTPLQRDALLLSALERTLRKDNQQTLRDMGLNRKQRRCMAKQVDADIPGLLEGMIRTATAGLLETLKGAEKPDEKR